MTIERESELCEAFMKLARAGGWTPYPECAEWDVLLVGADGTQIGVEAKLRCNVTVLAQICNRLRYGTRGPDYVAALVPSTSTDFRTVAHELRVGVFSLDSRENLVAGIRRSRAWSRSGDALLDELHDFKRAFKEREKLPPIVVDRPAGMPSPSPLTDWRVRALKLCALLRSRGHVTRADFKALGIDPKRWIDRGRWLEAGAERGQYVGNFDAPDFPDRGWEAERDAIAALAVSGAA